MEKYGNWLRIKIGLGCLFGIRYVFFFHLPSLPFHPTPHPVIGLFSPFADGRKMSFGTHLKMIS